MKPLISLKELTKVFYLKSKQTPLYALKGVNLDILPGEIWGIIGRSGAGKSTLLHCLVGLEQPTSGEIEIHGTLLNALSKESLRLLRHKIGMIFQHFNLLSARTVLGNILYPMEVANPKLTRAHQERGKELLDLVGLAHKQNSYPSQLSGGEQQRVAIARALANDPFVLICDEATSALDPHTTHSLLELLEKLNRELGLTMVMITHQMEVIKQICSKVAVLEQGEIVEQGSTLDLFSHPNHSTTRRFLQHMVQDKGLILPPHSPWQQAFWLRFRGDISQQPLISRVARQFNVEVNILAGGIERIQGVSLGTLLVQLSGEDEQRSQALLFLMEQGIQCEEIHDLQ